MLSTDDRIGYIIPKLDDYRPRACDTSGFSIAKTAKLFTNGETGLHEVKELSLPEYKFTLTHADIVGAA